MVKKRLYLIDATAFCYRAFYALGGFSTTFGQPTNAIFGFINILNKILKEKNPEFLAVCFDVSRDTARKKKFAEYKIQRPPMPDNLSSQIPYIKQVVAAYGLAILEKPGFEADDIIATAAKRAREENLSVTIISSDKDILQMADDNITIFSPYKEGGITYDPKAVLDRYGVGPERITDIIALMGDDVDNIPGVPGIGEKTAVELLKKFGSLDNLLANLGQIGKVKLKEAIAASIAQIKLSKELAVLDDNVDIDFDLEKFKVPQPDSKELYRIFKHLEFKKFLKELPGQGNPAPAVKVDTATESQIKGLIEKGADLFLYGDSPQSLIFCAHDKYFRVDETGKGSLAALLSNSKVRKISYDLKKIKVFLAEDNISLGGLYFDLMIASYLLNPAKTSYTLADTAWDYLDKAPAGLLDNAAALKLIVELKPRLNKELEEKSLSSLFSEIEMPLVEVLAGMEINGIKLDLDVLRSLSKDIEKRLIELISEIYSESQTQFNINSTKQLRDILFEKLKLPVVKKGKTGPSTDEEVLRKLASKHKLPALLLEYRQLMKLKTTYIDTLPEAVDKKTGRIHTSFNQAGTETGRLSSSNPNLQNMPIKTDIGKNIRRSVIAYGKDDFLLSCDYSQIELRILAHLSGDQNLKSAFSEGKDIHKATAALIHGVEEKDVASPMREMAKRINFGIIYGLSSYGLSRDLGLPIDEAQQFIDAYFLRYPQVKEYIQDKIDEARKFGFVTTISGRRRYLPQINDRNQGVRQFAERQAVNTPIQGSAADLIKLAMVHIDRQISQRGLKSRMVLQVHDELVFNVRNQEEKEMVSLARDKMENVMKLDVPISVDIKKGQNWLEMEPACRQAGR